MQTFQLLFCQLLLLFYRSFGCSFCRKNFDSLELLKKHFSSDHYLPGKIESNQYGGLYACTTCGKEFSERSKLFKHLRNGNCVRKLERREISLVGPRNQKSSMTETISDKIRHGTDTSLSIASPGIKKVVKRKYRKNFLQKLLMKLRMIPIRQITLCFASSAVY